LIFANFGYKMRGACRYERLSPSRWTRNAPSRFHYKICGISRICYKSIACAFWRLSGKGGYLIPPYPCLKRKKKRVWCSCSFEIEWFAKSLLSCSHGLLTGFSDFIPSFWTMLLNAHESSHGNLRQHIAPGITITFSYFTQPSRKGITQILSEILWL